MDGHIRSVGSQCLLSDSDLLGYGAWRTFSGLAVTEAAEIESMSLLFMKVLPADQSTACPTANKRILMELLAPPFLAAVWLAVASFKSETILSTLAGFLPLLFFACLFGLIPSLVYALAMEIWFRSRLRRRFGLFCTVGFSSFLGAGAGFLATAIGALLGFLFLSDCPHFSLVGAVIGLSVGFNVGRKQTSSA